MKSFRVFLIAFLTISLTLTPRMVSVALAQDEASETASPAEMKTIQLLAKKGYLGDKKEFYLSAKTLTPDDVLDALLKANDTLGKIDLKSLKPGDASYDPDDLQALSDLVKDKSEDLRGRKASPWTIQNRLKKMIAALSKPAEDNDAAEKTAAAPEPPKPVPTATPVPAPGASREEVAAIRDDVKDLLKKVADMQTALDKKMDGLQKGQDDIRASNKENSTAVAENQEQLRLVKRLMEKVQEDLKKTDDHLDLVEKKATEKSMTDTELQQELNVMHKDLRDNSQDVSILKQQVARLDKSGEKEGESPLDTFLSSKVLAGGALLVGITALIVTLTKK